MNIQRLTYNPAIQNSQTIRSSLSVKKLFNFFQMYGKGRNEKVLNLRAFVDSFSAISNGCGLRIAEDKQGNILAGYTYKIRKNRLEERSMYIDGLARNLDENKKNISKNLMTEIYEDIKKTAIKKKVKEITLFVYAGENGLKRNYQRLGFKEDHRCNIEKVYLMRVRLEDFLNNTYFKCRKFKELINIKSFIQKH